MSNIFNPIEALNLIGNDLEFFQEIVNDFLMTSQEDFSNIQKSIESQNFENTSNYAHKIKGGASQIGAERVMQTALAVEENGKQNDSEQIKNLLNKLQEELIQIKETVKHYDWNSIGK